MNYVDPEGLDWYINNLNGYDTWFDKNTDIDGYTYFGPKNSLFGEGESLINDLLIFNFETEGLYTDGFHFEIARPSKTSSSIDYKRMESGFLWDFVFNIGPEFSIILEDPPFIQAIKTTETVQMVTETIKSSSDPLYVKTINKWSILDAFTTPSTPLQFIGSFALRARTSPEGQYICSRR